MNAQEIHDLYAPAMKRIGWPEHLHFFPAGASIREIPHCVVIDGTTGSPTDVLPWPSFARTAGFLDGKMIVLGDRVFDSEAIAILRNRAIEWLTDPERNYTVELERSLSRKLFVVWCHAGKEGWHDADGSGDTFDHAIVAAVLAVKP